MSTFSSQLSSNDRANLRQALERLFDLEELETLAFDLGVNYNCLPHATTVQLSRELAYYFERRGKLYDLIIEVLRRRDDEVLKSLSIKLAPCFPRKKAQIILDPELHYDPDETRNGIAILLGISANDVDILGSARSSLRLLVSLPQQAANVLVQSRIDGLVLQGNRVISITLFDSLDVTSQEVWRIIVQQGSRQPLSWKSILESINGNPSSKATHEYLHDIYIIGKSDEDISIESISPTRYQVFPDSLEPSPKPPLPLSAHDETPLGDRLILRRLTWPPTDPPLVLDTMSTIPGLAPDFLGIRQLSVQNRVYDVKPLTGNEPVQLRPRQKYWLTPLEGASQGELVLVREQVRPNQAGQFVAVSEPTTPRVWIDKVEATEDFTHIHILGKDRTWRLQDDIDTMDFNELHITGIVEAILIPAL